MCVWGGVSHTGVHPMAHDKCEDRLDAGTGQSAPAAHLMHVTEYSRKAVSHVSQLKVDPKKSPELSKCIENAGMQRLNTKSPFLHACPSRTVPVI